MTPIMTESFLLLMPVMQSEERRMIGLLILITLLCATLSVWCTALTLLYKEEVDLAKKSREMAEEVGDKLGRIVDLYESVNIKVDDALDDITKKAESNRQVMQSIRSRTNDLNKQEKRIAEAMESAKAAENAES